MGLIDRVGRVISSNFNALLDRVDDPGKSVDQILLDMREQLRAARAEVVRAVAMEKQLRGKGEALDAESTRWEERASLALSHGDEALAREALSQKRRVVAERDRAEALRAEQRAAALEMRSELERMQAKVQEIQSRRSVIVAQAQMARAGAGVEGLGHVGAGPAPLEELRRMEDQIEGIEASVEAERELDALFGQRGAGSVSGLGAAEVEAKFKKLEAQAAEPVVSQEIEAELAALKRKVRVKV
jgi:phage shock protein A